MAAHYNQALIFYQDSEGKLATSFIPLQDQADTVPAPLVTLAEKFQACSLAKVIAVQQQVTHPFIGGPLTGAYSSVWDRALCKTYIGSQAQYANLSIVGPKASIFQADTVTLNLSDPNVSALVAQILLVVGNAAGAPVTQVVSGVRQRARGVSI